MGILRSSGRMGLQENCSLALLHSSFHHPAGVDLPVPLTLPTALTAVGSKNLGRKLVGSNKNLLEVGVMVQADALSLLEKKLGSLSDADADAAIELVQIFDYIPLAISQTTAYIQIRALQSSLKKYLDEFRKYKCKNIKLLEYNSGNLQRDGSASNAIPTI